MKEERKIEDKNLLKQAERISQDAEFVKLVKEFEKVKKKLCEKRWVR